MTDFLTPAERSERMSRIGGKNTRPEILLRRALHALGLRYRLHVRGLPGKPDLVFPRHRTVVFVHGCFWHRHEGCKVASTPKSNTQFWLDKFEGNVARDRRTRDALVALGWRVLMVWECELGSMRRASETASRLASQIRQPPDV